MLYSVHFLRFVAAIGVALHHFGLPNLGGVTVTAAGLDVFFVISGVVIGTSTAYDTSITVFALKRLIRIVPLYWLATAAAVLWTAHFSGPPSTQQVVRSLLLWPDLSSNWLPSYLPAWSLVYELWFYAAFAACMLTGRYAKAACAIIVFIAAVALEDRSSPSAFGQATLMWVEFCFGLCIAMAIERKLFPSKWLGGILVTVAIAWFASYPYGHAQRWWGWGIPSALLVYGILAFDSIPFFRTKLSQLGGNASYGIYLFHATIFGIVAFSIGGIETADRAVAALFISTILSILAGCLAFVAFEAPALTWLRSRLLTPSRRPSSSRPTSLGRPVLTD